MSFSSAQYVYKSSDKGTLDAALKGSRADNVRTVKDYCTWLTQMGADFEVRYVHLGYLLIVSNVQAVWRAQNLKPKLGIKRRTNIPKE